jgi:hypothetical protein
VPARFRYAAYLSPWTAPASHYSQQTICFLRPIAQNFRGFVGVKDLTQEAWRRSTVNKTMKKLSLLALLLVAPLCAGCKMAYSWQVGRDKESAAPMCETCDPGCGCSGGCSSCGN